MPSSLDQSIRRGVSLIEVLVVLAIVGLLLSLLLVGLSSLRESSRKINCSSRMRDLGLALQNYDATFRAFPQSGYGWSVHARLLPFLGEENRYKQIRFGEAHESLLSESFMKSPHSFLCPSDPTTNSNINSWAINYVGVAGGGKESDSDRTGLLTSFEKVNSEVRTASVTDGLSNTAAFTETMSYFQFGDGTESSTRKGACYKTSRKFKLPFEFESFTAECFGNDPGPVAMLGIGTIWADPSIGISRMCLIYPKQIRNCLNGGGYTSALIAPSSPHQEHVYCAFGDGHVRLIDQGISPEVWQAFGTRNGGEPSLAPM